MAEQSPARTLQNGIPSLIADPDGQIAHMVRTTGITLAVLFAGLGSLAAFVPMGGAVIGSGQVGVKSLVKQVTHPFGGVVSEILVTNGQRVKRGQVLIRLDDRVTGADATLSELSVDQLLAQQARLKAERIDARAISFPSELFQRNTDGSRRAMADEEALFRIRATEFANFKGQLDAKVMQHQQEIAAYNQQISALQEQAALLVPERDGLRALWEKKLVTVGRLNQLERAAVDVQGRIGSLRANIAQSQAQIAEARQQMLQLAQTRRAEAGKGLADVNAALNQQQMRSVSAVDTQDRSQIRAPHNGIVDKLAVTTIGGVIRPAEVLMEIVPDKDSLIVEGMISPSDVDQVHAGLSARVRFTSLNTSGTPEIRGKVTFVAPERTTDRDARQSYYAVRVELDEKALQAEKKVRLKPGMPAEVMIETGARSMLSYLTKPLRDQFTRAFRDN